uniref:Uncharacterized protein n=1 Tax=Anguilla anguilla TaxID=7936 RepID=A0A0E9XSN2_ANGAN
MCGNNRIKRIKRNERAFHRDVIAIASQSIPHHTGLPPRPQIGYFWCQLNWNETLKDARNLRRHNVSPPWINLKSNWLFHPKIKTKKYRQILPMTPKLTDSKRFKFPRRVGANKESVSQGIWL